MGTHQTFPYKLGGKVNSPIHNVLTLRIFLNSEHFSICTSLLLLENHKILWCLKMQSYCVCARAHAHVCVCVCTYTCMHLCLCMYECVYTCVYMYVHACVLNYVTWIVHMHAYTYTLSITVQCNAIEYIATFPLGTDKLSKYV